MKFKPYIGQANSDLYYLKVAISIYQDFISFITLDNEFCAEIDVNKENLDNYKDLVCFITCYFEDIRSNTVLFKTFQKTHQEWYGRPVPFDLGEEYYEGEINKMDILFLIWYFENTHLDDGFELPYDPLNIALATIAFDIFDKEWEYAPVNEKLENHYTLPAHITDFYQVRSKIDDLLFNSYLFYPDTRILLENEILELSDNDMGENLRHLSIEVRDLIMQTLRTYLLALKGSQWLAHYVGAAHPRYLDLLAMSTKTSGYFYYKGQDLTHLFIEHIACGNKLALTKESINFIIRFEPDDILYMGVARWRGEWWFSGMLSKQEFNADLILDEKNSPDSRMKFQLEKPEKRKLHENVLHDQKKIFLKLSKNKQAFNLQKSELTPFMNDFVGRYNDSLNLSQNQIDEVRNRHQKDGFFNHGFLDGEGFNEIEKDYDGDVTVFFNPKNGIEVIFGYTYFFNQDILKDLHDLDYWEFFLDPKISRELIQYWKEHYSAKSTFPKTKISKLLEQEFDFFLRFSKRNAFDENHRSLYI